MLAEGSQTVLVFKQIQLIGDWVRMNGAAGIIYNANRAARLAVVVEDPTGADTTSWFNINADGEVWVIEDVIHIPALCVKSAPGNQTKCRG